MTGWPEFALAMALFVGSHFLPRIGDLRAKLIAILGRRTYFAAYGLLSLALLAWVILAALQAPYVELWSQRSWTRWTPNLLMPVAILLTTCGFGMAQPFTLGSKRGKDFDPLAPGFAAVSRHPLLLALGLWATSHIAPNGDAAHVILFGCFALLAFAAIPLFDLRARRAFAPEDARAFFASTAVLSLAPFANPDWRHTMARPLLVRSGIGLLLWIALLLLHGTIIGASPFPL